MFDNERRYLLIDTACFFLLTPLGAISALLCIQGAAVYYTSDNFWTGFGLVLLTGFLIMMYFVWMVVTARYHYMTFKRWQSENTTVRLVFSNHHTSDCSKTGASTACPHHNLHNNNKENAGGVGDVRDNDHDGDCNRDNNAASANQCTNV